MKRILTHGSLFSGIGGFDLGFEWAGIESKWQVEIDPFCQRVLKERFPNAKLYDDVTKVGKHNLEPVDILSGGFPCQDISVAGLGKGLKDEDTGERTRSGLWEEMFRIIGDLRPKYVCIENVAMLLNRGGTRVIADLTKEGYNCEWQIISAGGDRHPSVGAWHQRARLWIVAYPEDDGSCRIFEQRKTDDSDRGGKLHQCEEKGWDEVWGIIERGCQDVSDTQHNGSSSTDGSREEIESQIQTRKNGIGESEGRSSISDVADTEHIRQIKSQPKNTGSHRKTQEKRCQQTGWVEGSSTDVSDTDNSRLSDRTKQHWGEQTSSEERVTGIGRCNPIQDSSIKGLERFGETGSIGKETDTTKTDATSGTNGTEKGRSAKGTIEQSMGGLVNGIPPELVGYWREEPKDIPRITTKEKERVNKLKALGNAVVPVIPYIIGTRIGVIESYEIN